MSRELHRITSLLGLWTPCLLLACAAPSGDGDPAGTPASAIALRLGQPTEQSLDCGSGDCEDWFRFDVPEQGTVSVRVEAQRSEGSGSADVQIAITAADASILADAETSDGALRTRWVVTPTPHYFRVIPATRGTQPPLRYTLRADYEVKGSRTTQPARATRPAVKSTNRPDAKPQVKPAVKPSSVPDATTATRSTRVVEALLIGIEGGDALIGIGSAGGISVGLRGRVIDDGNTLGSFEVSEVFPEGSRARLVGGLTRTPGPKATAEIEVPIPD